MSSQEETSVIDEYELNGVKIRLVREGNQCKYLVEEPSLEKWEWELLDRVIKEASREYDYVEKQADKIIEKLKEKISDRKELEKLDYILRKIMTYDVITPLLDDPNVEEIECRGPGYPLTVVLRKGYSRCIRFYTNIVLETEDQVRKIIERLALRSDKPVNLLRPYLEFSLPEGHRVAATVSKEISLPGSTFDVRKFSKDSIAIFDVLRNKTITPLLMAFLWYVMDFKPFMMILGPTGSGKTTFLNALLTLVNPDFKIITIEDTPELSIPSPNWVRFLVRQTFDKSAEVSMNDLARLALRYRPDYLVVGEVRGKEIEALIHASASGHGSLTTFHGVRPSDALIRVNVLLDKDTAKLFLSTITMFVVVSRVASGIGTTRKVIAIYEKDKGEGKRFRFRRTITLNYNSGEYNINSIDELVNRSLFLREVMRSYDLSQEEVKNDILKRLRFLEKITKFELNYRELVESLHNFYNGDGHVI